MTSDTHTGDPVVVGIDGSAAAVYAAHWAAKEAVARDVPLRLVSCVQPPMGICGPADWMVVEYAQTCLRAAQEAVEGADSMVKIETAILEGSPTQMLIAESHHAAMLCVGSVGIGRVARACLGSTATEVAEGAHCSVAVIHGSVPRRRPEHGAISVGVGDSAENDDVIAAAVAEAQLRSLPIVAVGVCAPETGISSRQELTRRVAMWRERYPDLQITAKPVTTGIALFMAKPTESIELVVIGADDATDLPTIIGPHTEEAGYSVLIVRS